MSKNNQIQFLIDEPKEMSMAQTNLEFVIASGKVVVKVDQIDMTEYVGSDRIIEFASNWLKVLPEIIEGKGVIVNHGEESLKFSFKRENKEDEDSIICGLKYNEVNKYQDLRFPTREYCLQILQAVKELQTHMDKNILSDNFRICKAFKEYKNNFIKSIVENGIVTKTDINRIFDKKKQFNDSGTRGIFSL